MDACIRGLGDRFVGASAWRGVGAWAGSSDGGGGQAMRGTVAKAR